MLVLVFYATEGADAKLRARQYNAEKHQARVYDVSAWNGSNDQCDVVEIMPDVRDWQIKRIVDVFGDKVMSMRSERDETQDGSMETGAVVNHPETRVVIKKAVHRGGGRWFVVLGDEDLSGPHSRAEAKALAEAE